MVEVVRADLSGRCADGVAVQCAVLDGDYFLKGGKTMCSYCENGSNTTLAKVVLDFGLHGKWVIDMNMYGPSYTENFKYNAAIQMFIDDESGWQAENPKLQSQNMGIAIKYCPFCGREIKEAIE